MPTPSRMSGKKRQNAPMKRYTVTQTRVVAGMGAGRNGSAGSDRQGWWKCRFCRSKKRPALPGYSEHLAGIRNRLLQHLVVFHNKGVGYMVFVAVDQNIIDNRRAKTFVTI